MCPGSCGKVLSQSLRTRLADTQRGADGAYRWNPISCQLSPRRGVMRAGRGCQRLRAANDHHQEFIRSDQRDRRPRRHRRAHRPVPEAVRHVGRERRRDTQAPSRHRASAGTGAFRRAESSITIELA
jgi:hypothetical protein